MINTTLSLSFSVSRFQFLSISQLVSVCHFHWVSFNLLDLGSQIQMSSFDLWAEFPWGRVLCSGLGQSWNVSDSELTDITNPSSVEFKSYPKADTLKFSCWKCNYKVVSRWVVLGAFWGFLTGDLEDMFIIDVLVLLCNPTEETKKFLFLYLY